MAKRDLYAALGVSKGASEGEIKKSYRKLARDLHPDRNPDNEQAENRFKEVSYAYEVLSDKKKRALYDEFGEDGLREGFDAEQARAYKQWSGGGGGSPNWGSAFEDLFRSAGGRGAGGRGSHGAGQAGAGGFAFNLEDLLGGMAGGGIPGGGFTGRASQARRPEKPADVEARLTLGFVEALKGGERELKVSLPGMGKRAIKARFPAGVRDGGNLRLRGQGTSGAGGVRGDLVLRVSIGAHEHFWREGDDLHVNVPVTPAEAHGGTKLAVPTLGGEVTLTIPKHTQGGAKLRLRGKGSPVPGKKDQFGDLYVHIQVAIPEEDSDELTKALETISASMNPRSKLKL